jgi:hypothetical protein
MSKVFFWMSTTVAVSLAVIGFTACGKSNSASKSSSAGTSSVSGEVVARVGSTPITKAELNHWMQALAGGDFYEVSAKHTVPPNLVSEPPNYAACVASLESVASKLPLRPPHLTPLAIARNAAPRPTAAKLLSKCRELHQALRLQALNYLVETQWITALDAEQGITATDDEVMHLFKRARVTQFPTEADLQRYLASRRWVLADELYLVKLDVLAKKAEQRLASGGKQTFAKFTEAGQRTTARTNCRRGYVVQHCRQYTGGKIPYTTSPAILMEQVSTVAGRLCTDYSACG